MRKNTKYTKQLLEDHAKKSNSFGALLRSLGLKDVGGNFRHIQIRCRYFDIDTSHFTGQGWNKGLKAADHPGIATYTKKHSLSFADMFCENSRANTSNEYFRRSVIKLGVPYKCETCGNEGTWNDQPLTLDLDHKNGVSNDNRLENLRFLCPNCHRQTPTWGKRKNILIVPEPSGI
jgi:predicted RNA-binding Zn-ribbon protein involved in translation (DUF1610 family)